MKRFLLSLIITLFVSIVNAANPDSLQVKIDSLQSKIIALEKKVAFSDLEYPLKIFINEISLDANGISDNANNVNINILRGIIFRRMYEAYSDHYKSFVEKRESYNDLLETFYRKAITFKIVYNFSDTEWDLILQEFTTIKKALDALDSSLELYGAQNEAYKLRWWGFGVLLFVFQ